MSCKYSISKLLYRIIKITFLYAKEQFLMYSTLYCLPSSERFLYWSLMMISRVTDNILTSQFRTFWSNNQSQAWKTQNNAKCPKLAATRFSNLWCNEELAGVFFSGSGSRSKIRHIAQGWPLFNIFNQIVKVKVEIRECFLIQYFFFYC